MPAHAPPLFEKCIQCIGGQARGDHVFSPPLQNSPLQTTPSPFFENHTKVTSTKLKSKSKKIERLYSCNLLYEPRRKLQVLRPQITLYQKKYRQRDLRLLHCSWHPINLRKNPNISYHDWLRNASFASSNIRNISTAARMWHPLPLQTTLGLFWRESWSHKL